MDSSFANQESNISRTLAKSRCWLSQYPLEPPKTLTCTVGVCYISPLLQHHHNRTLQQTPHTIQSPCNKYTSCCRCTTCLHALDAYREPIASDRYVCQLASILTLYHAREKMKLVAFSLSLAAPAFAFPVRPSSIGRPSHPCTEKPVQVLLSASS